MKRINIESNETHFIGCWNIEDNNLSKNMVKFFDENEKLQNQGLIGGGKDLSVKNSIDITIQPNDLKNSKFEIFNEYMKKLHECYQDYLIQYPLLKGMIKDIHIGKFNLQKYRKDGHFSGVHSERTSLTTLHRLFAWMTYLNDVEDGGVTNFSHYKIDVKPEIGKTIIWPSEWTHAHSGGIVKSGTKYIITGWMHFPYDEKK